MVHRADKTTMIAGTILATLVLLLGVYVGAYLSLSQPYTCGINSMTIRVQHYQWESPGVAALFRPANWIDRRLRPGYWAREQPPKIIRIRLHDRSAGQ
jgi:hypothetical protein